MWNKICNQFFCPSVISKTFLVIKHYLNKKILMKPNNSGIKANPQAIACISVIRTQVVCN